MPEEVRDRRPGPVRVLVVDDEPAITEFIRIGLSREGFEVETAQDGRAALAVVDRFAPDVVVLDVMMPRMDGIALTRELAGDPRRGLVILSARDDTQDRIRGLDVGADDYLGKPFEFGELLARVRSVLRRRQPDQAAVLWAGPLQLDRSTRKVCRDSHPVELSPREFDLLAYLMEHQGEVLTRDRLMNSVWGVSFYGDENNLEVYIRYLRLKLKDTDRQLIQTVRGVGYRLGAD
ncbi:MAG TPA: response regulator transcription factor [Candidatus Dormibacteraeota bacterium]|nr:response regulator transcription factor [Candidatus Dormibacteraeota bacterium]